MKAAKKKKKDFSLGIFHPDLIAVLFYADPRGGKTVTNYLLDIYYYVHMKPLLGIIKIVDVVEVVFLLIGLAFFIDVLIFLGCIL